MHDAFISYARSDSRELVARLAAALEAAGKDLFVDLDDIPPASRWERDLREGIAASAVFVFVISPGAVASEHCGRELEHAREANKRIIPIVRLEVANADVPAAVGQLNWIPQQGCFEDDFDASLAKLLEALETDAEALRSHARWQQRAETWRDEDRNRGLLATGAELREADSWLEAQTGRKPEPTPLQAEWIAAGRRQAVRRQRGLFGAAMIALLISAVLGVLALIQRNDAIEQRDIARADELASDSTANLESDPELSLILALEAARTQPTERSEDTLRRALLASHVRVRMESGEAPIDSAEFSPDGRLVALAIEDGTARITDGATGETVATLDTGAQFVGDAVFSPDGRKLFTGDSSGRLTTWAVPSGQRLSSFRAARSGLVTVAVSPDGRSVATGSQTGEIGVFDLAGRRLEAPGPLADRINSVAFSPDGRRLLTASRDDSAGLRVWSLVGGETLALGESGGQDARFSPNGDRVAAVGIDGSAEIWDAETGEQLGKPLQVQFRGFLTRVAWVPSGDAVIAGGQGGQVTAFDLKTRTPIDEYRGHRGYVLDVSASPDGSRLITAGEDGTARIWDRGLRTAAISAPAAGSLEFSPDSSRLLYADGLAEVVEVPAGVAVGHVLSSGAVYSAAFSPDGTRFATGEEATAHLFDADTARGLPGSFRQDEKQQLFAVGWSADGSRLMTAGRTSGVTVWDVDAQTAIATVPVPADHDSLFGAALSPDGRHVATFAGGDEATITDVTGQAQPIELVGHSSPVNAVAYDGTGQRLVTGSSDGSARVWDAADGHQMLVLNNDGIEVRGVAFSANGRLIATTGVTGELRVWDASTGRELLRLQGADDSPALSPDGSLIAASDSAAGQVSIYECDVCEAGLERLEQLAEQRITRAPTPEERGLYLDG